MILLRIISIDYVKFCSIFSMSFMGINNINPIQDGGKKAPLTHFLSVTSTKVRIISQNFLTFSFNHFDGLM